MFGEDCQLLLTEPNPKIKDILNGFGYPKEETLYFKTFFVPYPAFLVYFAFCVLFPKLPVLIHQITCMQLTTQYLCIYCSTF